MDFEVSDDDGDSDSAAGGGGGGGGGVNSALGSAVWVGVSGWAFGAAAGLGAGVGGTKLPTRGFILSLKRGLEALNRTASDVENARACAGAAILDSIMLPYLEVEAL